jgi:hypothetical protein
LCDEVPGRCRGGFERYPSLLVFSILVALTSVLSNFPGLSLSKLVGFLVGVFVILMLFQSKDVAPPWLNQWIISLGVAVALVSLPLIFMPLGYVRNGRGFQGILNHPQALGVFLALFVAYFGAKVSQRDSRASLPRTRLGLRRLCWSSPRLGRGRLLRQLVLASRWS